MQLHRITGVLVLPLALLAACDQHDPAPQQQGEAAPRQAPAAQPAQPASQPAPKLDLNLVPKSP
jgi:hypothetical protein